MRDVKRLTRLLCDKIETIDPGFGIEIMTPRGDAWPSRCAPKQTISSLIEEPEPDVSGLIDTLANRVGEQRLYRVAPVASDVPERSVQRDRGARRPRPARHGRTIGRGPRACCRARSRSRRWRCCPIIRPSPSPGAACAGA